MRSILYYPGTVLLKILRLFYTEIYEEIKVLRQHNITVSKTLIRASYFSDGVAVTDKADLEDYTQKITLLEMCIAKELHGVSKSNSYM